MQIWCLFITSRSRRVFSQSLHFILHRCIHILYIYKVLYVLFLLVRKSSREWAGQTTILSRETCPASEPAWRDREKESRRSLGVFVSLHEKLFLLSFFRCVPYLHDFGYTYILYSIIYTGYGRVSEVLERRFESLSQPRSRIRTSSVRPRSTVKPVLKIRSPPSSSSSSPSSFSSYAYSPSSTTTRFLLSKSIDTVTFIDYNFQVLYVTQQLVVFFFKTQMLINFLPRLRFILFFFPKAFSWLGGFARTFDSLFFLDFSSCVLASPWEKLDHELKQMKKKKRKKEKKKEKSDGWSLRAAGAEAGGGDRGQQRAGNRRTKGTSEDQRAGRARRSRRHKSRPHTRQQWGGGARGGQRGTRGDPSEVTG